MVYIYASICKGVFNMTWGFLMSIVNNWQLFHVPFLLSGTRFWERMVLLCEVWLLWSPPGNMIASQRYEKYAKHQVCDFDNKPHLNHTCMLDSIRIVFVLCVLRLCSFVAFLSYHIKDLLRFCHLHPNWYFLCQLYRPACKVFMFCLSWSQANCWKNNRVAGDLGCQNAQICLLHVE